LDDWILEVLDLILLCRLRPAAAVYYTANRTMCVYRQVTYSMKASMLCCLQVRGALGVHGSGLMNVHWASPRTVVYEIWPVTADKKRTRGLNVFWEQAALKGASYWWFHAESGERWNVNVDCDLLVQAVDKGLTPEYPPMLEQFYQGTLWSAR
jgi:hypothetical protein